MSEILFLAIFFCGVYLGLPIALLFLRDWWMRPSKATIEVDSRRFVQRLLNPDFGAIELHFGRPVAPSVLSLYADRNEVLRCDFAVATSTNCPEDDRWYVSTYRPADGEELKDCWPGLDNYFAFADDGSGNGYLIDPTSEDSPVVFHLHETGEVVPVCERLAEFMSWPRVTAGSKLDGTF